MASTSPRNRPRGLTPRSYQARVDLCRLWDLMLQGRTQAEIAQKMGKDPAWVSRSVKRLQADTSLAFQRPQEAEIANEHLARLERLYSKALAMVEDGEGMAQVAAIRTASTLLRDKMQFMQFVGLMREDQETPFSKMQKATFPEFS